MFLRQERCFGWRMNRRFVLWMTQAGTRLFEFVALLSRIFLASGLFLAMLSLLSSLDRDLPIIGGQPLQYLDEICVVDDIAQLP